MTRKAVPDPFVEDVFARNEAVKKPWIKAEVSSHMWVARLPAGLPAGTHRVTVTAVNEYGRTSAARWRSKCSADAMMGSGRRNAAVTIL